VTETEIGLNELASTGRTELKTRIPARPERPVTCGCPLKWDVEFSGKIYDLFEELSA
jgi:hypothetical protein